MPTRGARLQAGGIRLARLQDALIDGFAADWRGLMRRVDRRVQGLVHTLGTRQGRVSATAATLGRVVQLRTDLTQAFRQAGLQTLAREATGRPFDRLAVTTRQTAQAAARLTPISLETVATFKSLRQMTVLELGENLAARVWRTVLDGVFALRPVDRLLGDLRDLLDGSEVAARRLYDTAVATFSQQTELLGASGAASESFLYVGPVDERTRPFCRRHVGRVLTRKEIENLDNEQLPDVLLTRGGYNCRHQWKRVSIFDEELRDLARTGDRLAHVAELVDELEEAA